MAAWLKSRQQADGGWGESCGSYWRERKDEKVVSTSSQTAWALLALMAAGETESDAVARGIEYLRRAPRGGATWRETLYNAVGFPRVFYLRYHGYSAYFPLWALARAPGADAARRQDGEPGWGRCGARLSGRRLDRLCGRPTFNRSARGNAGRSRPEQTAAAA